MTAPARERLDKLLVARGLEESRERAQRRILAGEVLVAQRRVDKPGTLVASDAEITVAGDSCAFVSRGGLKLEAALEHWQIDVRDRVIADIGASTGGFTDCLLQRGARKALAIDVGYGQFAWKLRQDPRVELLERTNFRTLDCGPWRHAIDLAAIDVSFISLRLILPNLQTLVRPGGRVLPLVKPQFEVGKDKIGKGGVVRDPAIRREAVDSIRDFAIAEGWIYLGTFLSPVVGPKGNREFFLHLQAPAEMDEAAP